MTEWQPIETAPNAKVVVGGWWSVNGVLKWHENVTNVFVRHIIKSRLFRPDVIGEEYNAYINSSYTHWRPLPDPPQLDTNQ